METGTLARTTLPFTLTMSSKGETRMPRIASFPLTVTFSSLIQLSPILREHNPTSAKNFWSLGLS